MAQITLRQLRINNFKGISNLSINFDEKETNIFGENGTGKTSVFDSFLWLLFGKDSQDRKDFGVKPVDSERAEVEVSGVFDIDGNETHLKRILVEKWQKKRGSSEQEFTGNETKYFWNEVPFSQSEWQSAIKQRIDENLFKLLTNPETFANIHWKEKREILFSIAGLGSDAELASELPLSDEDVMTLVLNVLNSQKTIKQKQDELSEKKKKLKAEIEQIAPRIDELKRSIQVPEISYENATSIIETNKSLINVSNEKIASEHKRIDDANSEINKQKTELSNRINSLKIEISSKENDLKIEANKDVSEHEIHAQKLKSDLSISETELRNKSNRRREIEKEIEDIETHLSGLRTLISIENEKFFKYEEKENSCPTCKQSLPSKVVDIDVLRSNFNTEKKNKIDKINAEGTQKKLIQNGLKQDLELIGATIEQTKEIINQLKKDIELHEETKPAPGAVDLSSLDVLREELSDLEISLSEFKGVVIVSEDVEVLKKEVNETQEVIRNYERVLIQHEQNNKTEIRINELLESEKSLSIQLSQIEGQEDLINRFSAFKINTVTEKINSMFSFVKFKMFNTLINGGVEECCEILINNVPYSDANTASKINAGLDIINTLSSWYNVSAPCFIDGAESITGFINFNNQIIKLIVSQNHKTLTVS